MRIGALALWRSMIAHLVISVVAAQNAFSRVRLALEAPA
jgi:hypothetical protein